jgi:ABC-2 type transport system ATP-binding protein
MSASGVRPPGATVRLRDLTKRYGGRHGVLALDGLDLDVPAGSVFGLLGPNGAGKTTTLRLLVGLAHQTRGTVEIDPGGPLPEAGSVRRGIGVLDQDPRYYGWMRGRELVELVARLHGQTAAEARARSRDVIERVGLAHAAERRISGYSGGMRQRLGIAQALVDRPRLLVLDEPVSSLDPEGRRDVLELIEHARESATVIFSTHVLADIERICDRVAILDAGRLIVEAPLAALLARYALPLYRLVPEPGQEAAVERLEATLRAEVWTDRVERDGGTLVVGVTDEANASRELLPAVVAAGVRVASFERVRPDLEDVFLRLVGRDRQEGAA